MKWLRLLTCVGFLTVCGPGAAIFADYPQPSIAPLSWDLEFKHDLAKRIVVTLPGETTPTVYWYMTFSAVNNTGEDRPFLPVIEMLTKDGQVLPSEHLKTSPAVFEAIAKRERNLPLQPLEKVAGSILVGEDQGKTTVAIWKQPMELPQEGETTSGRSMEEMGNFSIYVAGLSGETAPVTDSDGKPIQDKDGHAIIVRKTKQIEFTARGDTHGGNATVVQNDETWVMR